MRSPLVVLGAFVAILGYAIVYNGLSNLLSPSTAFPAPMSVIGALTGKPTSPTSASTTTSPAARSPIAVGPNTPVQKMSVTTRPRPLRRPHTVAR